MIIDLNESTRIVGAKRAWELQQLRTRKGKTAWEAYKWLNSFRSALEEAVHEEIRLHPAQGLAEAIEAVTSVVQRYEALIPSEYRVSK